MHLRFLESEYSVCQFDSDAEIPSWARGHFLSVTRTPEELTIIAPSAVVPDDTKAQHGFACFRVDETLEFDAIGIIASISQTLARQKIPLLSISTYNTDYFFVDGRHKAAAKQALQEAGNQISD